MYYDTMVFSEEGLRHLVAEVGADRLCRHRLSVSLAWTSDRPRLNSPGLSDAEREAILGGTAAALLGLPPRT